MENKTKKEAIEQDIVEMLRKHEEAIRENLRYRKELEHTLSMMIDRMNELQRAVSCLRDQFTVWIDGKKPPGFLGHRGCPGSW